MHSKRSVTEVEFNEWRDNPVTKEFFATLRRWREDQKEVWASGAFTDQSQFGTVILNAKAIGNCEALDRIVGFEYVQLESEKDNGE